MKLLLSLSLVLFVIHAYGGDTIPLKRKSSVSTPNSSSKIKPSEAPNFMDAEDQVPMSQMKNAPKPYVASLDTFGSSRLDVKKLKKVLGKELDTWIEMGLKGDPNSLKWEARLAKKIKDKFEFAEANWSIVQAFAPGDLAFHIVLDVVEKSHVKKRMPFHPKPKGKFEDPDELIKKWIEYETAALKLVEMGKLDPDTHKCPAFHCPFGHKHPKLEKYQKIFVKGVKKNFKKLVQIQKEDKRVEFRGIASYLLAYHKDGKEVVKLMMDRVRDPEPLVRNNALRVLGDIAEFHRQYVIPLRPLLRVLDFPRVSDRHKALYVIYLQTEHSQKIREEILNHSFPYLLRFLTTKQPEHKDLAYDVLRKISSKEYPKDNVSAWNTWYLKYQKDMNRAISLKK